jgi:hypothetical protein
MAQNPKDRKNQGQQQKQGQGKQQKQDVDRDKMGNQGEQGQRDQPGVQQDPAELDKGVADEDLGMDDIEDDDRITQRHPAQRREDQNK